MTEHYESLQHLNIYRHSLSLNRITKFMQNKLYSSLFHLLANANNCYQQTYEDAVDNNDTDDDVQLLWLPFFVEVRPGCGDSSCGRCRSGCHSVSSGG